MNIQIGSGTGTGPTKLSAFDSALNAAGVANFNLIRLSSIIPPNTKLMVNQGAIADCPGEWGDKLYVVMADMRVDTPNAEAWAGIGWVIDKTSRKGLFVEHESASEETVKRDIKDSLESMMKVRNYMDFGPIQMKIVGETCVHEPVCALVIAVYEASGWKKDSNIKMPKLSRQ